MTNCYHTYLRWVEQVAICALCQEAFDYPYDPSFVGTFPHEDYKKAHPVRHMGVASTLLLSRYETDFLDWQIP